MGRVNVGHYVVGTVGLALLRTWLTGDGAEADRRLAELRELVSSPDDPPLTLKKPSYYMLIDGQTRDAFELCYRYISILDRIVERFEQD